VTPPSQPQGPPGALPEHRLLHPLALAAVALLVLNDHVLKPALGGAVTGKLSDLAGLTFFPLLLDVFVSAAQARAAAWRDHGARVRASDRSLLFCCVVTALAFTLVKTWGPAADAYRHGLALLQWPARLAAALFAGVGWIGPRPVALVMDATDLWALPAVLLAWVIGRRWRAPRRKYLLELRR
jgi:hypothetical protein